MSFLSNLMSPPLLPPLPLPLLLLLRLHRANNPDGSQCLCTFAGTKSNQLHGYSVNDIADSF